jgi:hypothetical protein
MLSFQRRLLSFTIRARFTPPSLFHTDADRRDRTRTRVRRWGELTARRCVLRLADGDPVEENALEAPLLREPTPRRAGLARERRQACLMGLPCRRGPQDAEGTALSAPEEVLERVARLLAAVVGLLGLGSSGAVERSLRALRPTRGG